jgi:hypothetical protein
MDIAALSIEDIVGEAIRQERDLECFYKRVVDWLGPEASPILNRMHAQLRSRIAQLEQLLEEIHELRELTGSIAD